MGSYIKIVATYVLKLTNADWVGSPSNRRSTTSYCSFRGENLLTSKSTKQAVVIVKSTIEAKYQSIPHNVCKLI